MPDDDRVYVFSCGTQYLDWQEANCCSCRKRAGPDATLDDMPCALEQALTRASFGDGKVPLPIADRMGATANRGAYNWPCGEHDPPFVNVGPDGRVFSSPVEGGGAGGA
jgi:hypothetical protein